MTISTKMPPQLDSSAAISLHSWLPHSQLPSRDLSSTATRISKATSQGGNTCYSKKKVGSPDELLCVEKWHAPPVSQLCRLPALESLCGADMGGMCLKQIPSVSQCRCLLAWCFKCSCSMSEFLLLDVKTAFHKVCWRSLTLQPMTNSVGV